MSSIDRRPADSGSIIIGSNEHGIITVGSESLSVVFHTDSDAAPRVNLEGSTLTFINMDSPVGSTANLTGLAPHGPANLRVALWTMGNPVVARVLHWTLS